MKGWLINMIKFSEEERKLLHEAKDMFPGEGIGYNWDEWSSIKEWYDWLSEKVAKEKAKRASSK